MTQPDFDPYKRIQQLEEALKRVTDPNIEGECVVCLQSLLCYNGKRISVTNCGHTFHKSCLTKWWDPLACRLCPICRQRIVPCYNVPLYYHFKKSVIFFFFR